MAAAAASIAAGPSADAPAPAAAAAASEPAGLGPAPEKVDLPDKASFDRKVEALKRTMEVNKREKAALMARSGGPGTGPSKLSVSITAASRAMTARKPSGCPPAYCP